MIQKPINDAMWMVIGLAIAMVIASIVLDFSKLKTSKPAPTATAARAN